ncbi:MAG: NRDE family protein [Cycloclasticus sp.]|nr:NRDE family protein [Cycloclasticus sp.]
MCLIVFKYQPESPDKLILLANRDEYHKREAIAADYWQTQTHIFGGIDKLSNGSWLSVDRSGRLAVVTNIRKPPYNDPDKKSRGKLISDYLSQPRPASEYLNALKTHDNEYNLFNLLLMDDTGLWHYSNDSHKTQKVTAGFHGLSNSTMDTPWPKLTQAKSQLQQALNKNEMGTNSLAKIMQSTQRPADDLLPDTGVGIEFERFLSPAFIQGEDYGTRCTTLLCIQQETIRFSELTYDRQGQVKSQINQLIKTL